MIKTLYGYTEYDEGVANIQGVDEAKKAMGERIRQRNEFYIYFLGFFFFSRFLPFCCCCFKSCFAKCSCFQSRISKY